MCRLIFGFFLFFHSSLVAQQEYEIIFDSTAIEFRQFDTNSLEAYRSDRAYNYGKDPKYETNFIRRLWLYFINKLEEIFGAEGRSLFWNLIWYGLAFVGLIYFIFFIIRKDSSGMFARGEGTIDKPQLNPMSKDVDSAQFDNWIVQAIEQKDYRLAIRLFFLKTLKLLDAKDLIEWKAFKTNTDYIKELGASQIKEQFADLSHSYEYIWYGEFQPDLSEFKEIEQGFNLFLNEIKPGPA